MKETARAVAKYPSRRATHPVLAPFYALKFYGNAENRSTVPPYLSLSPLHLVGYNKVWAGRPTDKYHWWEHTDRKGNLTAIGTSIQCNDVMFCTFSKSRLTFKA